MKSNCRGNLNQEVKDSSVENQVFANACNPRPPRAPYPMPEYRSTSYARYNISTIALTNRTFLPLALTNTGTTNYNLTSGTTITLPAGFVYKVDYLVQAILPDIGFITISPLINNASDVSLSSTVNSYTGGTGTFSASGGFIIEALQPTTLALQFLTDEATTGAVTGTLSIYAVSDIVTYCNPVF